MSLNTVFNQVIEFPDGTWFNEIEGFESIPDKAIIYKTKTGLGATFSEISANRNSIVMLPHVSIIKNKHEQYQLEYQTFAVYGDGQTTEIRDIVAYLLSDVKHKKFLTTPRGLEKIKVAIKQISENGSLDPLYSNFFLLTDECHKWIKDTDYREDMVPPMDDFFLFKQKAMVSATPLPFSDPRFKQQGFKHILLKPVSAKVIELKLIQANNVTNTLKDYIEKSAAETYCIFFNSISGIKSLIADLDILPDSRIFCSSESCKVLKLENDNYNVSDEFKQEDNTSLSKYNFFTSSFYTGLDIKLSYKPNVVILTDACNAPFSIVDPYTDVIQILGRFRNDMINEAVHINDYTKFTRAMSEEKLEKVIEASKLAYNAVNDLRQLCYDDESNDKYSELLSRLSPYANFIDITGTYSAFKEDNYKNENRVKDYYGEAYKLNAAYRNSGFYNLLVDREIYEKHELIKLKKSAGKYSTQNNMMAAAALEELEEIKGTLAYINYAESVYRVFPIVVEAFERFGIDGLQELKFRIKAIKKHIILYDAQEKKNSFPMIDLVYESFQCGRTYTRAQIKATLQRLYDSLGIEVKAKASHINQYFTTRYRNAYNNKSNNALILFEPRFNRHPKYFRQ